MASIDDLRRRALARRRALSPACRRRAAYRAGQRLVRLPAVRHARHIGLYWPLPSEIDPRGLICALGKQVSFYLPRVEDTHLCFVALPAGPHRWRHSALGVAEPVGRGYPLARLDLLVMPLAGFDARAHRIGLGGGFYDRALAALRHRAYRRPHCIGLAFEAQRLDEIKPRAWDVPLDAVVTEAGVYRRAGC